MPSLAELFSPHASLLVVDTSSQVCWAGLWQRGIGRWHWSSRTEEAGQGLFAGVEELSRTTLLPLAAVEAFVFNEGPGSLLGIRTAAVALRAWQALRPRPCYRFNGLQVLAHALARQRPDASFTVIADARRDSWHAISVSAGSVSPLRRVPTASLSGPLLMPAGFRHWTPLPLGTETVSYLLSDLLSSTAELPLLFAAPHPDAFVHEEPTYQTWSASIHRAPSP